MVKKENSHSSYSPTTNSKNEINLVDDGEAIPPIVNNSDEVCFYLFHSFRACNLLIFTF